MIRIRSQTCAQTVNRSIRTAAIRSIKRPAHQSYNQCNHTAFRQHRRFSTQTDTAALIGMSLSSHQASNQAMWDSIAKVGLLTDQRAIECVKQVDRKWFINQSTNQPIYDPNLAIPIGCGATIATPVSQARALQAISHVFSRSERVRVLDLGSGSGYVTNVLALMAGERGWAVGVEHAHELVQNSDSIARRYFPQLVDQGRVQFIQGDARTGCEKRAPFDLIHSGIALEDLSLKLLDQLAPGGVALIPLVHKDGQSQSLMLIEKQSDGTLKHTDLGACGYSRVRNAPPPSGHDSIEAFKAETQQLVARMKEHEESIKKWRASRSGPVTLADFESDEIMSATLKEYSALKKKVQARLRVEAQQL